jgi:hypothetical protein
MFLNDCSSNSPIFGSACRAPDNCSVCGGALGGAGIGCDPSRSDECPPDQHCNGTFDRYSFCAR